jgi:GNAT superfamily N-acetyltransferase
MSIDLKTRAKRLLKVIKFDILYYFLNEMVFVNKVAVTVEKDLSSLPPLEDALNGAGVKIVEITPDSILQGAESLQALIWPAENKSENRYAKALRYLRKGYRGLALVRGKEVSGDIWYVGAHNDQMRAMHPDMKWLGIRCKKNEAYAFDMHLYPGVRGKNLAALLQNGALHEMKKNGFTRAFGYYWAANLPALWVHRTLRFKELDRVNASRFLFIRRSQASRPPLVKQPSMPVKPEEKAFPDRRQQ